MTPLTPRVLQRQTVGIRSSTPNAEDPRGGEAVDALDADTPAPPRKRRHVAAYVVVPMLVMVMAAGARYLEYQEGSFGSAKPAAITSVQAGTDGTVALLSYRPDTVQATLTAQGTA